LTYTTWKHVHCWSRWPGSRSTESPNRIACTPFASGGVPRRSLLPESQRLDTCNTRCGPEMASRVATRLRTCVMLCNSGTAQWKADRTALGLPGGSPYGSTVLPHVPLKEVYGEEGPTEVLYRTWHDHHRGGGGDGGCAHHWPDMSLQQATGVGTTRGCDRLDALQAKMTVGWSSRKSRNSVTCLERERERERVPSVMSCW
jgi:hypothetical protein